MNKTFRLGTRRSDLATTQSTWVKNKLEAFGLSVELVLIESAGDLNRTDPLYAIEGQSPGLFTKQLENALLEGKIDIAVHSLKDLPTEQPSELEVAAVPERESAEDVLVVHANALSPSSPWGIAPNTIVGTSSLRREAQLLACDGSLEVRPIRGNVPTRVGKVSRGDLGAVVLARAGLNRLGWTPELPLSCLPLAANHFIPAPGQGALAIELRRNCDPLLRQTVAKLNHPASERATRIERLILRGVEGGCTLPFGAHCLGANPLKVNAFLGVLGGAGTAPKWRHFHRFDFSHSDEEILVRTIVNHFKGILDGR